MTPSPYSPAHERLRTLGVLHYIAAGLMLALMQVPLFLLGLAAMELLQPSPLGLTDGKLPPLVGWFSVAVACGALLFIPLGTLLGAATQRVLRQNSVRSLYGIPLGTPQ